MWARGAPRWEVRSSGYLLDIARLRSDDQPLAIVRRKTVEHGRVGSALVQTQSPEPSRKATVHSAAHERNPAPRRLIHDELEHVGP